jgi:Telomere resolvase
MLKWLEVRLESLVPELDRLGVEQEEEVRRLCEAEKAFWRGRPGVRSKSSLRVPMTQARNRIRELDLRVTNQWWNPKTGEREHIALKYLNFSEEEWIEMGLLSEERREQRLASPLFLREPLVIVRKGEELLGKRTWPELVLGVVVTTGRSIAEVLQAGRFEERSAHVVLFEGGEGRQDRPSLGPYELPTLVPARLVLDTIARVRAEVDCRALERREVSRRYRPAVEECAYQHFLGLVPLLAQDADLYRQLSLGVYTRLAVYYHCPAWVPEIQYMATIRGHRLLLETQEPEKRLALAVAAHYLDYVVVDGSGQVDGRQGLWLSRADVEVIAPFACVEETGGSL